MSQTATRTPHRLPQEMRRHGPGVYSIHFYGEAAGVVQEWDGRWAEALVDADQGEALAAGAADPDTGEVATVHADVLLVDADGECWLLDTATL